VNAQQYNASTSNTPLPTRKHKRVQVAYSLENRGEKEEEDRRIKELGELLAEMQ